MLDSEIDHQILMLANERMEESGLVEWPQARRRDDNNYIGLWVRNGEHFRNGDRVSVETYYCPLRNRMDCKVQIRVIRSSTSVCLETSGGAHTQELCHAQDKSKFLNVKQRLAVAKVCKVNPSATSGDVRRALNRLSPGGKVKKTLSRSVRTVVKIQKRASLASLTDGVEVTNSYASIAALGDRLWFGDILRRHNDDEDDFHFSDPHKVFCIGNVAPESAGEEIFLNITSMWNILNLGRGLQSGWPNVLSGDGTGKISNKQVTMVSFGINSIPAKFNTLNYCIGPVENGDIYIKSWDGVESTWYDIMLKWKCCQLSYAHCRVCALISVVKSLATKELIEKAKSDNTDLFRNFAETIGAIPLTCDVHGSGKPNFFTSVLYALTIYTRQLSPTMRALI